MIIEVLKIYFYTFGCKTNQYETQLLREQLFKLGLEEVYSLEKADIFLINSCTVTHDADADCRQLIRKILRFNPLARIIVTGCYATRTPEEIYSACGKNPQVVVIPRKEGIFSYLGFSLITNHASFITAFNGRTRAFVKIQDGCDAFCSYCIVPYVRPKLLSRNPEEIISEVKNLVDSGYKEIVLTGIRLGKYQAACTKFDVRQANDKTYNLTDLLRELEKIEGLCQIRLSSLEIHEVSEKLLRLIAESKKICHHLHLPLQSGDDKILKLMNRPYKSKEFNEKIEWIRSFIPDIGITTDIIVGFPGEEKENFLSTYQFAERVGFSRMHLFPYSVRPMTAAAKLKFLVPEKMKKLWMEKFLTLDCYLRNKFKEKFIGQEMDVLLDKEEKDGTFSGFTGNYIRLSTKRGKKNEVLCLKIS